MWIEAVDSRTYTRRNNVRNRKFSTEKALTLERGVRKQFMLEISQLQKIEGLGHCLNYQGDWIYNECDQNHTLDKISLKDCLPFWIDFKEENSRQTETCPSQDMWSHKMTMNLMDLASGTAIHICVIRSGICTEACIVCLFNS